MIKISCKRETECYRISLNIQSHKDQETFEIYAFIKYMLRHDPALINAVLAELMPEITESTYNMDPDRYSAYMMLLEDII